MNDAAPTALMYSTNPAMYVKGTLITPNNPSNTGGAITAYTVVGAALPTGLNLNGGTGVITGTPTAVTAKANYIIQGSNVTGSTQATLSITVNDAAPAGLTYSVNPAVYVKGTLITPNNPSSTGGAITAYAVVGPALPAGLNLNTSTGVITGTPTAITAKANYTIQGSNVTGSTQVTLTVTVNDALPTNLTYSANPAVYTVGTLIPQNIPSSTGGAVVSYSALTTLPPGLSINGTTGVISGTPTAAVAAGNYTIQATNSGGSTTASLNITVDAVLPTRFAFAVNENDATICSFTVNEITGQLRATGYALVGTTPRWVAVTPSGTFAYVTSVGSNNVSVFSINATSGVLASLGTTTAGTGAFSVAIDPTGSFAYVSNFGSNNVSAFSINPSTGALTAVGTAVAAGTGPTAITVDPTGRFVYVANETSGDVSAYAINRSTGALTSVGGNVVAGTTPYAVAVDPSGRFAYVVNQDTDDVSAFTINQSSGALASVGAAVAAGSSPGSIAVDPAGKYVFVGNAVSNSISTYTINSTTGAITAFGTAPTTSSPASLVVDRSGTLLYVANSFTNQVTTFSLNESTGALAQLDVMSARSSPVSLAIAQGATAVQYVPKFAYVGNNGQ